VEKRIKKEVEERVIREEIIGEWKNRRKEIRE
jgi:hypothetical protein